MYGDRIHADTDISDDDGMSRRPSSSFQSNPPPDGNIGVDDVPPLPHNVIYSKNTTKNADHNPSPWSNSERIAISHNNEVSKIEHYGLYYSSKSKNGNKNRPPVLERLATGVNFDEVLSLFAVYSGAIYFYILLLCYLT